jgi:hypothetical protein
MLQAFVIPSFENRKGWGSHLFLLSTKTDLEKRVSQHPNSKPLLLARSRRADRVGQQATADCFDQNVRLGSDLI